MIISEKNFVPFTNFHFDQRKEVVRYLRDSLPRAQVRGIEIGDCIPSALLVPVIAFDDSVPNGVIF